MAEAMGTPAPAAPSAAPSAPSASSTPKAAPSSSVGTPAKNQGQAASTPSSKPYFDYKFDDGEEVSFKSPDELAQYFRGGVLRHKDYTKKTQAHSEQVKQFESERKKHEATLEQLNGLKGKYDKIEQFVKQRPDVYDRILKEMKQPSPSAAQGNAQKYFEEQIQSLRQEYDGKLSKYEERMKREEDEARRKSTIGSLKSRYEDFDEDSVNKLVSELTEQAPGDELHSLMELLYWANKGRGSYAKMEEKLTDGLKRKAGMKPTLTGSPAPEGSGPAVFKNIKEAAAAAKKRFRE
jgi:hypothetical protein